MSTKKEITICVNCRYRAGLSDPICKATYTSKFDFVHGELRDFKYCRLINTFGNCPKYEEKD